MIKTIDSSALENFTINKSPYTRHPFSYKNHSYATDGTCFIIVDRIESIQEANKDQINYLIHTIHQFDQFQVKEWVELDHINYPELGVCSICKGRGRLQTGTCPYCKSGFYRPTLEREYKGLLTNAWSIKDILDQFTGVRFGLLDTDKHKMIKIEFNEGYGYLSAWRKSGKKICKACLA